MCVGPIRITMGGWGAMSGERPAGCLPGKREGGLGVPPTGALPPPHALMHRVA